MRVPGTTRGQIVKVSIVGGQIVKPDFLLIKVKQPNTRYI